MIEFIAQNMAPIMFASLIIFLLIGYPVAFSLAANGLMFFFIGVDARALFRAARSISPGRCCTRCRTISTAAG